MIKILAFVSSLLFFSPFFYAYVGNDDYAPNFQLLNTYGEEISLNSFKGKRVVLEWTNHGCPFVAKHYKTGNMQETQNFAKAENAVWLTIISSAPGTQGYVSPEEANILTSTRNASPSHVLLDPTGTVGQMFEAKTTPHMYILDEKGLMKYQGAIDDAGGRGFMFKDLMQSNNYVKEGLKELKDGKSVTIPITKPYGCSVKYAS